MGEFMNRVLVFGMTENPGGIETFIMNYYRNIDRTQLQFDFIYNSEKVAYQNEIEMLGGRLWYICARSANIGQYYKDIKTFFSDHASEYKAIWINMCNLSNIDYLKFAQKYRIPVRIIHSHNSKNMEGFLREVLHRVNRHVIHKYATNYWACSDVAGKWFYNKKVMQDKYYRVIHNAINIKQFAYNQQKRDSLRRDLGIENKLVIGNVGRFHFQKNHEFLIRIFAEIHKRNKQSVLLLVGQGELEADIREQVRRLHLEEHVSFLGLRNDVSDLMSAMDVFLFPSVFEGLGIVAIEAQASGLPCIVSTEVPQDAKVTDRIKFIPLSLSAEEWAKEVLACDSLQNSDRLEVNQKLLNSNFNIEKEAKFIQSFFQEDKI